MKNIFLAFVAVASFSFSSSAIIRVTKENGGFFGYRTVTEDHTGSAHYLGCADPGKNKCKWINSPGTVTLENGEDLVVDDLTSFEDAVVDHIRNGESTGSFYFGTDFYIKYFYDEVSGKMTYEIYSLYEAHKLGYI